MDMTTAGAGYGVGLGRARHHVTARVHSSAPPTVIWPLLADVSTWPRWGPWDAATLMHPGSAGQPGGVGAVRRLQRGPTTSIEEVMDFRPPHRLAYRLRSGLPLRGYRAEVRLRAVDDGTVITWHAAYDGALPGMGPVSLMVFGRFITRVATALARAAEADLHQAAA